MKIHEYQAKEIMARYGIPIQPGKVAHTPEEAEAIARELGGPVVIKAQVYVGGRGKAGGIQFGDTPEQAREAAARVLGMDIKGLTVEKVLVVSKLEIAEEYYMGIILDRKTQAPVVMVSKAGGIDIEEVAATAPEKIMQQPIDMHWGLRPYRGPRYRRPRRTAPQDHRQSRSNPHRAGTGLHRKRRQPRGDQSRWP